MHTIPRHAAVGLLVYGIGVTVAFMNGAPGGEYANAGVPAYVSSDHWASAFAVAYVGALSALGLSVFGHGLRPPWGAPSASSAGGSRSPARRSAWAGSSSAAGVDVAMAEGGRAVQAGVADPVVYTLTEIGNLLLVCAPAFFTGVIAIVLAVRSSLPTWLRALSASGGVRGPRAVLLHPYLVFALWTVVATVALLLLDRRATAPGALPRASLV